MAAKKHGCLLSLFTFLLVMVLIVVVAAALLVNLTPRQLGLANTTLVENHTADTLGLADVRIVDALTFFKSIVKQHGLSDIAPNAYTETDEVSARVKFKDTLIANGNETPHYKWLLAVSCNTMSPIVLRDTELACTINSALQQFYVSPVADLLGENLEAVQILQQLKAAVVEMDFSQQNGKMFMRTVIKLDISDFVAEINAQSLPEGYRIADYIFCTLTNEMTVSDSLLNKGALQQKNFQGVEINDQNPQISLTVLNALFKLIAADEEPLTAQQISRYVCTVVAAICENIGGIGTGSNLLNYNYGVDGINVDAHTVTFLPR